jgi:hypothetical protein
MNEQKIDVLAVMDTDGRAVATVADGCLGLRRQQWESHLVIHDEARAAVAEMIQLLRDIQGCGDWYSSALEIDTYAGHGHDGESLKRRIDAALARIGGEA